MAGMQRGGVAETWTETILRRLRTITPLTLGLVLVTALLPVLLVLGLVIDVVRRVAFGVPPTAARLALFLWVYLAAEVGGSRRAGGAVAREPGRPPLVRGCREMTWRVQQLWAGASCWRSACCSACGSR